MLDTTIGSLKRFRRCRLPSLKLGKNAKELTLLFACRLRRRRPNRGQAGASLRADDLTIPYLSLINPISQPGCTLCLNMLWILLEGKKEKEKIGVNDLELFAMRRVRSGEKPLVW